MYCSKCGKEVSDEAVVCIHCGCLIKEEQLYNKAKERKINALCLTGFILAIVSFLISLCGIIATIAIILCRIGVSQAKRDGDKLIELGSIGFMLGVVSFLFTIVMLMLGFSLLSILLI